MDRGNASGRDGDGLEEGYSGGAGPVAVEGLVGVAVRVAGCEECGVGQLRTCCRRCVPFKPLVLPVLVQRRFAACLADALGHPGCCRRWRAGCMICLQAPTVGWVLNVVCRSHGAALAPLFLCRCLLWSNTIGRAAKERRGLARSGEGRGRQASRRCVREHLG